MSCFYFCFFLLIFVFKVLGSPEINFLAYKQNLIKTTLANVLCKKAVPTAESYPIKMSQKDIVMKMERSKMKAIIKTIVFS